MKKGHTYRCSLYLDDFLLNHGCRRNGLAAACRSLDRRGFLNHRLCKHFVLFCFVSDCMAECGTSGLGKDFLSCGAWFMSRCICNTIQYNIIYADAYMHIKVNM